MLPAPGTFTANSAYDNLNVGDNVNETFNVATSVDGTPSTVYIHDQWHQRCRDSIQRIAETLTETDAAVSALLRHAEQPRMSDNS